jgi:membrane-associated phospholipid phosphatase
MKPSRFPFFYNFCKNIAALYQGRNLLWQLAAFVLTYVIVVSDVDWKYYTFVQSTSFLRTYFGGAVSIGMLLPLFGLPALYILAKISRRKDLTLYTWAITQSAMLGWLVSAFYKALTGRVQPPHSLAIDTSHDWNFGFYKHGIFWGWPSSHTTVAFAMAFTLIALYPKNKKVLVLALLYAFYIGIGVSTRIHWFSEFAAGAIIGAVIGTVVGRSFSKSLPTK